MQKMMLRSSLIIHLVLVVTISCEKFKVIREWNYVNFTWPSENVYRSAVSNDMYIKENNIIAGLRYFEDYYYVTLPRMKSGVPATLARFSASSSEDTSPFLMPFPSWEMNRIGNCDALQNVQNIEIDPEGRVWIIDNGITETLSANPKPTCPPKLIIFDIKKNSTTVEYTFPDEVASYASNYLYDIVIDNTDGGYGYITDNSARDPGIIVYSLKSNNSWKIRHSRTMKADPTATAFRVNDVVISAPINIASISLGPRVMVHNDRVVVDEDRKVFFSPISSLHMYSLNSSVLKNENSGLNAEYQGDIQDYGLKASQSVGMGMDNQGTLYFGLLASNSIAKWNTHELFLSGQKIISKDSRYLEWPNSFTIDSKGNLIVLVNKLNKFISHNIDVSQTNFWVIVSNVGSKGYLYDESVEYKIPEVSTVKNVTTKQPDPEILPGSPQDAFFIPVAKPNHKATTAAALPITTPEPEIEPEPTTMDDTEMFHEHVTHMHTNLDKSIEDKRDSNMTDVKFVTKKENTTENNKMHQNTGNDISNMNSSVNETKTTSRSNRLVVSFISLLFTSCLFAL